MALISSPFRSESESRRFQRPLMLKDFLLHSSSSNGFISFPRRSRTTVRNLLEIDLSGGDSTNERRLYRSRSTTSSALRRASETVIHAVKHLPFYSVKSPPSVPKQRILGRSLSQMLRRSFWKKKHKEEGSTERSIRVRVRDMIRWKPFGDEEEEKNRKRTMDFSSGMGSARSSSSSGWLESDCASDSVQSWSGSSEYSGENEGLDGKKDIQRSTRKRVAVGDDSMETATCRRIPKVEEAGKRGRAGSYEEKDQLSPVSVLDLHPYEDEESPSSNLPNTKWTKKKIHHKLGRFGIISQLGHKLGRFGIISQLGPINVDKQIYQTELEEEEDEDMKATDKAYDLLKILKARHGEVKKGTGVDRLMLDFFREGLVESKTKGSMRVKEEEELLRTAGRWMNLEGGRGLGVEDNKVAYVKGMEESGRWMEFGMEQKEAAVEVETHVFGSLLEELLLDLLSP